MNIRSRLHYLLILGCLSAILGREAPSLKLDTQYFREQYFWEGKENRDCLLPTKFFVQGQADQFEELLPAGSMVSVFARAEIDTIKTILTEVVFDKVEFSGICLECDRDGCGYLALFGIAFEALSKSGIGEYVGPYDTIWACATSVDVDRSGCLHARDQVINSLTLSSEFVLFGRFDERCKQYLFTSGTE